MIINAENLILGRLASFAAKKALLGQDIDIVNCEKAVITGKRVFILDKYKKRDERGDVYKGPFFYRKPDKFVKRAVRGMLSYKKERGKNAFEKIRCYIGIPDKFKQAKLETIKEANVSKTKSLNYMTVEKISKHFLGK